MDEVLQCIVAFIGCIGFSFIFRVHKNMKFAISGSLLGTLAWIIYLILNFLDNIFIQNFIAMLCVSLISEMMARYYKAPATIFIVIGFFPLVPGKGIYNTMFYAVQGQSALFMESLFTTLGVSLSLALAILISSTALQIYKTIKTKNYAKIE